MNSEQGSARPGTGLGSCDFLLAVLYHIELFALRKVSLFTASQMGNSCWH